jgi:hypothetical protein
VQPPARTAANCTTVTTAIRCRDTLLGCAWRAAGLPPAVAAAVERPWRACGQQPAPVRCSSAGLKRAVRGNALWALASPNSKSFAAGPVTEKKKEDDSGPLVSCLAPSAGLRLAPPVEGHRARLEAAGSRGRRRALLCARRPRCPSSGALDGAAPASFIPVARVAPSRGNKGSRYGSRASGSSTSAHGRPRNASHTMLHRHDEHVDCHVRGTAGRPSK